MEFKLVSKYKPAGDQPQAIAKLIKGVKRGDKFQTLLGVTGSGKTFSIANVIQTIQLPTLVISHNKTLAAQLYGEFKSFFPENAVEYFISYYDYYQPEAYLPVTDTYIEKDASINEEIERLRLKATSSLLERKDTVIVSSVSCIYGLGSPKTYKEMMVRIEVGDVFERQELIAQLTDIHYSRNDVDFSSGTFRVKGGVIELHPAYSEYGIRIELEGDTVTRIREIHPTTFDSIKELEWAHIYPAKHFVAPQSTIDKALQNIKKELDDRLKYFRSHNKLLEAQRLETRTRFDMEMMREAGYCAGIENYSRWLANRKEGERPFCLLDYFPEEFLMIIDESHVTMPQIRGMYNGDRSRKETLVEYGFRLPSALDNRPLKLAEFEKCIKSVIFTSATPADFERQNSTQIVEQIVRPTGLIDPPITVKKTANQIDDIIKLVKARAKKHERTLITTLTKRMAEDLADYLTQAQIKVRWMHSELGAIERVEILRGLRLEEFDCLVGINLLREGLDLPEVSLVIILDADREGFLRSFSSLIQTSGRTARHLSGEVIMYADNMTDSMRKTIKETNRRRKMQIIYNEKHNITPTTIYKTREEIMGTTSIAPEGKPEEVRDEEEKYLPKIDKIELVKKLGREMKLAAEEWRFEDAAKIRDRIRRLKDELKPDDKNSSSGRFGKRGRHDRTNRIPKH
ncbi:MAG: excinuclease ABC subunit UvrB [bacterium]|nr:excinuclease ABC subunit UvrB [bacterium]